MKTIALRYGENIAPESGTIAAHQELIDQFGYAWYGKFGNPIAESVAHEVLDNEEPRILLIHSGGQKRYWAYVEDIQRDVPPLEEVPDYYRNIASRIKCWFKVSKISEAANNIMSKCTVVSSGKTLSEASRYSMSPYFIIEYRGGEL